ncbi:MAG: SIMPL domain-containing protein [Candidatus Latescibacterota bacterium]|nr:SIMPL domain-containing protein [Candidatus Latescibacterota bacterium]
MTQFFGRATTDGGRSLSLAGRVAGVSLLCLVLAGGDARAGEGEAEGEGARRQITVSGQGLVSVRPDVVRVQLGLRVKAVAIGEAMEQNRLLMTRIVDSLREVGIEERDIITSRFSVHQERPPRPEDRKRPETPKYVVNNMVSVTIRDLDRIDDVLQATTDAGANEVHGINFGVEKTEEPASTARRLASEHAHSKAEELAHLFGASLGPVLRIREMGGNGAPRPMMAEGALMRSTQSTVSVGDMQFSTHIEVVYALK